MPAERYSHRSANQCSSSVGPKAYYVPWLSLIELVMANPGIDKFPSPPPEFTALAILFIVVLVVILIFSIAYYSRLMKAMESGELVPVGVVGARPIFVRRGVQTAYCPRCGAPVVAGWRYCPSCGYELDRLWAREGAQK